MPTFTRAIFFRARHSTEQKTDDRSRTRGSSAPIGRLTVPTTALVWPAVRVLGLLGALTACEGDALVALASLTVDPPALEFGKVATGQKRTLELRLTNEGGGPLTIERIGLTDGTPAVFELSEAPQGLDAGGSAVLRVTYSPNDAEPDLGHLLILSNAANAPELLVPLASARTFPAIRVDPARLELGNLAGGTSANATIQVQSVGDATLEISRFSFRSGGFLGEACFEGAPCREGRCAPSASGLICAAECGRCPDGYSCQDGSDGARACLESPGTRPPLALRGFRLEQADPRSLLPEASHGLPLIYAPQTSDRGGVLLVIESNDPERPVVTVAVAGRPDNLPPVAMATLSEALPNPILPGTVVRLTSAGSLDPEGEALSFRWRFVVRPEGSRAAFVDPTAAETHFVVDRPGSYLAALEARDPSGQASTNEARVMVEVVAGPNFRVTLTWDRPGSDLDLHVIGPGSAEGSVGDCYFENQSPTWAGECEFTFGSATETVAVPNAGDGVYTVTVRNVAPSPEGPTGAEVRFYLGEVEVAAFAQTIPLSARAWDVATLAWPSGRLVPLETVR